MRKTRIFGALLAIVALAAYAFSFEAIEPVCQKTPDKEYFLLNYISTGNLKRQIQEHNKNVRFQGEAFERIYLKNPILNIDNPVLGDAYDYRQDGCANIDNMDLYAEVFLSRSKDGTVQVSCRFYE